MQLTILGHKIKVNFLDEVDTKNDDYIYNINQSILDGNTSGDIEINENTYEWEIIQETTFKNICLEWQSGGTQRDFLMIDETISKDTIQTITQEALAVGHNQGDEFRQRLQDKGITFKEFECEYFDFN